MGTQGPIACVSPVTHVVQTGHNWVKTEGREREERTRCMSNATTETQKRHAIKQAIGEALQPKKGAGSSTVSFLVRWSRRHTAQIIVYFLRAWGQHPHATHTPDMNPSHNAGD